MRTHTITQFEAQHEPAYLSNGLMGLRVDAIPLPRGRALVSGFVGRHEAADIEAYSWAPYPLGADVGIDGVRLSDRPHVATFRGQSYDFSCGELTSRFDLSAGGAVASVEVLTLCCRTLPTVALQETRVTVDRPCRLVLGARIDPRGLPGRQLRRAMCQKISDGAIQWEANDGLSSCGAAFLAELIGDDSAFCKLNNYGNETDLVQKEYTLDAQPGRTYVLRQYGALVPSLMHAEPHWQAHRLLGLAAWQGFDKLRADNRAAWGELWLGRPVAHGAGQDWQDVIDAAFFYCHATSHASTPCSVAPFGLGQRDSYLGHVFWDTDSYILPAVLPANPPAARAMLDYRTRMLPAARHNAAMNGYRGVQFPWQSGNHGGEVTNVWARGGITEHHVNLDVAYAFALYGHVAGDEIFRREQAWPVLAGVAEWVLSRVTRTDRGYEIRHITGVDEGLDNVHNNSYTNAAAIVVLREAAAMARRLGYSAPADWLDVAENLHLPINPATHVLEKNDQFDLRGKHCCPESLGVMFLMNYSHSPAVDAATRKHFLAMADEYIGMPMLSSSTGVHALRLGDRDLGGQLLREGIFPFVLQPFFQFAEVGGACSNFFSGRKAPFLTNPAGLLMAVYYGLSNLWPTAGEVSDWAQGPVVLPEGWEAVEVERATFRGRPFRLLARHGADRAELTPAD